MITSGKTNDPLLMRKYIQDQWASEHPQLNLICKDKVYVRLNLRKEGAILWWRRSL